jgi:hypothetical protein
MLLIVKCSMIFLIVTMLQSIKRFYFTCKSQYFRRIYVLIMTYPVCLKHSRQQLRLVKN